MELPYMRLYTSDITGSPRWKMLTDPQRLALLNLLMAQHGLGGALPNDPEALRALADVRTPWAEVWTAALSSWFEPVEGGIAYLKGRQHTLESAAERAAKSAGGQVGNAKRWGKRSHTESLTVSPPSPSPSPSPSSSPSEKIGRTPASQVAAPPPVPVPEKKPRAEPTGPAADFRRWWCAEFEARTGNPYAWDFAKDGAITKALLGMVPLEEVQKRATRLLVAPAEWMADGGVDLGSLKYNFNKLATLGRITPTNGVRDAAINAAEGFQQPGARAPMLPTTPRRRLA